MSRRSTVSAHPLCHLLTGHNVVELVKGLELNLLAEDVSPEPPGQNLEDLVVHVGTSGHSKDVVKLLQGSLLSLRNPQEDHDKCCNVQTSV